MSSEHSWTLGHRPALDGLRAVAVLLVVAAHAQIPGFQSGGIVGVTMFFALSGFLITSLLLEETTEHGRVQLVPFYVRRALRLLPALVALVVVALVASVALGPEVATPDDAVAALLYYGNWIRADGGDLGSLSHVWSLAIEEQFYVLWPLVLLLLSRWRSALMVVAVGGAVAAVALRVLLWNDSAGLDRVYFGSDTRADAILLGSALAVVATQGRLPSWPAWVATAAVVLTVPWSLATGATAYVWAPLAVTLLSVTAMATIGGGASPTWLHTRALVHIGKRSYGLYLWHVPIFLMLLDSYRLDPLPWLPRVMLLGAVTWVATWLSYRYVETPALAFKRRWERSHSERAVAVR